jgi:hypothetical protein
MRSAVDSVDLDQCENAKSAIGIFADVRSTNAISSSTGPVDVVAD